MLILTRRIGENLMIGDDVVVSVLGIQGQQARLGISAPSEVTVMREEVTLRPGYDPDNKPERGSK